LNLSALMDLPSYAWKEHSWIKVPKAAFPPINKTTLKFVTYNIWFGDLHCDVRWQALADLVRDIDPDFICFQEATKPFLNVIQNQPWVREKYLMSDYHGSTFASYGVVLLSKYPCKKLEIHPYPSTMYRSLLIGTFDINGQEVAVATAHLESLDMSHFRRTQLILASELLAKFDHAFFMGDFNFDATTNFNDPNEPVLENNNIRYYMPQFVDTWQNLHPDQLGATFDTTTNLMVMNSKRKKIVRYDRILVKSSNWKPVSIEVIGNKEVTKIGDQSVFPSDHFGLTAQFIFNKQDKSE
jgi:endonuclease/exonuclease/phosphatase family metal-dependent hydrolase